MKRISLYFSLCVGVLAFPLCPISKPAHGTASFVLQTPAAIPSQSAPLVSSKNTAATKQEELKGEATEACFFADGKRLMLVYAPHYIDIWDMQIGTRLQSFEERNVDFMVPHAAITPDGRRAFLGGMRDVFVVWDRVHNQRLPNWGGGFQEAALHLAVSPDGKSLLLGRYGVVELRSVETGQLLRVLQRAKDLRTDNGFSLVAFSPNGKYALVGEENLITFYEVATGRRLRRLHTITQVNNALFSPDNRHVLILGVTAIRLWNWRTGKVLRTFEPMKSHNEEFSGAFTPDGKQLVTGDDYIRVYDVQSGREVRRFPPYLSPRRDRRYDKVLVSSNGKYVLSLGLNTELWRIATGERIRFWTVPKPDTQVPESSEMQEMR